MNFGSKLLHGEGLVDKATGAINTPIYQTSTFHQFDINNFGEFDYARSGNPTRKALERLVAELENGEYGYAFSSGMAAICSILSIFKSGDHILVSKDVYGGTYRAVTNLFSRYNIEFTFIDGENLEEAIKEIKDNTKGIYLESPSNPLLKITDLKKGVEIAKKYGLISIVDNTFMSPYLQNPLDLGIDIVVHSATKFLGGHSDLIAGVVVTKNKELGKEIYMIQNSFGAILGPQECFLLLRGIKTLKVRMEESQKNAIILANWLNTNKEVKKVYYPALEGHKSKEVHLRQSRGGGAVLSFELKDEEKTLKFLNKIEGVSVSVSLGGVETIVSYPVRMSHAAIPKLEREKLGIKNTLIRVSVGIEDINDIIYNFESALRESE